MVSEKAFWAENKSIVQSSRTPSPLHRVHDRSGEMIFDTLLNATFNTLKTAGKMRTHELQMEDKLLQMTAGPDYARQFKEQIEPKLKKNFWLDPIGSQTLSMEAPYKGAVIEEKYRQKLAKEHERELKKREREIKKIANLREREFMSDVTSTIKNQGGLGWEEYSNVYSTKLQQFKSTQPTSPEFNEAAGQIKKAAEIQSKTKGTVLDPAVQSQAITEYTSDATNMILHNAGESGVSAESINKDIKAVEQQLPDMPEAKQAAKTMTEEVVTNISDPAEAKKVLAANEEKFDEKEKTNINAQIEHKASAVPYARDAQAQKYRLYVDTLHGTGNYVPKDKMRQQYMTQEQIALDTFLTENAVNKMGPSEIRNLAHNVQGTKNSILRSKLSKIAANKQNLYDSDFTRAALSDRLLQKYRGQWDEPFIPNQRMANGDFDPQELRTTTLDVARNRAIFNTIRTELKKDPAVTNMFSKQTIQELGSAYSGYDKIKAANEKNPDIIKSISTPEQKWSLAQATLKGMDNPYTDKNGNYLKGKDEIDTIQELSKIVQDPALESFLKFEREYPGLGQEAFRHFDLARQQNTTKMNNLETNIYNQIRSTLPKDSFSDEDARHFARIASAEHSQYEEGWEEKSPKAILHGRYSQSIRKYIQYNESNWFFQKAPFPEAVLPGDKILPHAREKLLENLKQTMVRPGTSAYAFLYEIDHPGVYQKRVINNGNSLKEYVVQYQQKADMHTGRWTTMMDGEEPIIVHLE